MSETNGEYRYDDLLPAEFRFSLKGKSYVLHEPSDGAVQTYTAMRARATKMVGGQVSADLDKAADARLEAERALVRLSLTTASGNPPAEQELRGWPRSVVTDLFKRAAVMGRVDDDLTSLRRQRAEFDKRIKELEELEAAGESPEKNSPAGTTAG